MGECRWCGAPSIQLRELVPAKINRRTKKIAVPAVLVDVCDRHNAMFDREERRVSLEQTIARIEKRRRAGKVTNLETLTAARDELRALNAER